MGRLVVAFLRQSFPRQWTPKEIAAHVRRNLEAVNKACVRHPELIQRVRRGTYRAFIDAELLRSVEVPEPQAHGIQISIPVSLSAAGRSAGGGVLGSVGVSSVRSVWWHGRRVSVNSFPARRRRGSVNAAPPRVQFSLQSSQNPLSAPEFAEFVRWLEGAAAMEGGSLDDPGARIDHIEFNADFPLPKVGLAGWRSMTIHGFSHGLLKVYEKRSLGVVRIETPLWPVDLHPREAVRLLGEITRPRLPEPAPPPPDEHQDVT